MTTLHFTVIIFDYCNFENIKLNFSKSYTLHCTVLNWTQLKFARLHIHCIRLWVLLVVKMPVLFPRGVTQCERVGWRQRFRETYAYCLNPQPWTWMQYVSLNCCCLIFVRHGVTIQEINTEIIRCARYWQQSVRIGTVLILTLRVQNFALLWTYIILIVLDKDNIKMHVKTYSVRMRNRFNLFSV
jgi:hypothetical protein